jgi:DNA-binding transcriptional regulator LsrR (DeoR family)
MHRTPPPHFAGDAVKWAAWLYYGESRTQNDVAQELGVSRPTVANYLSEARDRGLVSITLAPDLLATQQTALALRDRFALAGVHVLPSLDDPTALRRRLGRAGGDVVGSLIGDGQTLGVSSGRTLSQLASQIPPRALPGATVIQIAGSSISGADHAPEVCAAQIATRLSARCIPLHAPAYLSDEGLTDRLLREPGLVAQFDTIARCDAIAFGIGELGPDTQIDQSPFLDRAMLQRYMEAGAVAIIFGRFLGADGAEIGGLLARRTIAVSLATAARVPARLAICGGLSKLAAVRAALAAGLVTHLVLDDALARALLTEEKTP